MTFGGGGAVKQGGLSGYTLLSNEYAVVNYALTGASGSSGYPTPIVQYIYGPGETIQANFTVGFGSTSITYNLSGDGTTPPRSGAVFAT